MSRTDVLCIPSISTFTGNRNFNVGSVVDYILSTSNILISIIANMGNVSFGGNAAGDAGLLNLGGIVGRFYSSGYTMTVKNCVNYGRVSHSGTASRSAAIGGIVGKPYSGSSMNKYIQNCLNYGVINVTGSSGALYIGGIVGYGTNISLINSLSAGLIKSSITRTTGSVVGYVSSSNTNATHCLWTGGFWI